VITRHNGACSSLARPFIIVWATACVSLLLLVGSAHAAAPTAKAAAVRHSLTVATTARVREHRALAGHTRTLKSCRRRHPKRCSHEARLVRHDTLKLKTVSNKIATLKATLSSPNGGSGAGSGPKTRGGSNPTGSGASAPASSSPVAGPPVSSAPVESGSFAMGVVSGSALTYELPFIKTLGAHTARLEFDINTPVAQMKATLEAYASAGIQPLLLASFYGRIPSPAEAQNLATWAAAFGPGGSTWQGKSEPANTAVTRIEFGNETSYEYQFSDNSTAGYANRAQSYALRFAEAATAIRAAAPSVGLLAQGDSGGNGPAWANQMFKAVPNLGQLVAGWTIHPYGPEWQSRIDNLISTTQADGAPSTIPIYVTEWGLDSDNGRCLENNFGWNDCMSYEEAATVLNSTISSMRARYGSRLAAAYLFQANDQQPSGVSTDMESHFGALQNDGSPKGAYTSVVESLLSANP
jgi:hypothetical protein